MVLEYWCFHRLGAEIAQELVGQKIRRAWLDGEEIGIQGEGSGYLRIRCGAQGYCLWDGAKAPKAPPVGGGALRYLPGARVVEVETHRRDRVISLKLERFDTQGKATYGVLHLEWLPRRLAAVLVSLRTGLVLGAWGAAKADTAKKRLIVGQQYLPLQPQARLWPAEDEVEALATLPAAEGPLGVVLEKCLIGCERGRGDALAVAVGRRADELFEQIGPDERQRLWTALQAHYAAAYEKALGGRDEIALRQRPDGAWSAFIDAQPGDRYCASVSQAILFIAKEAAALRQSDGVARQVRQGLQRRRKILERRLKALQADVGEAKDADSLERQGHSLLAAVDRIASGQVQVEVEDVYGGEALCIQLDPRLPPPANAARLLKRARRYRRRMEILPARLQAEQARLAEINRWADELEADPERAAEIARRLGEGRMEKQQKQQRGEKSQAHPRRYTTTSGWSVWAGRNNRENDIVSHKLAAQNDYWFHAHGYAGSHVILRREGRKEEPDRQTLEEAAAVAAFWSKGKTAKKVAVVYTLAKFVSKPRGGAPGLAAVRREKTLMVKPTLLQEEDA